MTVWGPLQTALFQDRSLPVIRLRDGKGPSPAPTTASSAPAHPESADAPPPPPGGRRRRRCSARPRTTPRSRQPEDLVPHLSTYVGLADHSEQSWRPRCARRAGARPGCRRLPHLPHPCRLVRRTPGGARAGRRAVRGGRRPGARTVARHRARPGTGGRDRAAARPPGPARARDLRADHLDRDRPGRAGSARLQLLDIATASKRRPPASPPAQHPDEDGRPQALIVAP